MLQIGLGHIPEGVVSIGNESFTECSGLRSIVVPGSVKTIGIYAFDGCSELASISLPYSMKTIEEGAFAECLNWKVLQFRMELECFTNCFLRGALS